MSLSSIVNESVSLFNATVALATARPERPISQPEETGRGLEPESIRVSRISEQKFSPQRDLDNLLRQKDFQLTPLPSSHPRTDEEVAIHLDRIPLLSKRSGTCFCDGKTEEKEFEIELDNVVALLAKKPFQEEEFDQVNDGADHVLLKDRMGLKRYRARLLKAEACVRINQFDQAMRETEDVPTNSSYYDPAQAVRAYILLHRGDFDGAITSARKVRNVDEDYYCIAQVVKAEAHWCKKEFDLAIVTSENVPSHDANGAIAQIIKAEALIDISQFDEAISIVVKIPNTSQDYPLAQYVKARALLLKYQQEKTTFGTLGTALFAFVGASLPSKLESVEVQHEIMRAAENAARSSKCRGLARVIQAKMYLFLCRYDRVIDFANQVPPGDPMYGSAKALINKANQSSTNRS